ncbi:TIGR03986 family type III CRISPR-associated RAMP protein [Methanosalsum natronophilum]|uniref:TIGR03986 family type III CRISPR-associated RAMP protein n=1 Tax=Methanosalsum natronophilum TaxID=768733 RepID=UPI002167C27B|nr:TIGR03986 family CRISPR-associated RAMP protein [Methanosalsum natronophilum]MCS3924840.1 CRISPR-associated protein (TIGR03986 family) [Methanosalsum natronophilum]
MTSDDMNTSLPKHTNPNFTRDNGIKATAPYNFIPLPDKAFNGKPHDQDAFLDMTGYIDCTLKTETPLYIRGALTPDMFKKISDKSLDELSEDEKEKVAAFFSKTSDTPVIPGSSLRGMIRNLTEIVGYGKMDWVTDTHKITYRAVASKGSDPLSKPYADFMGKNGSNINAGYLTKEGDTWYVQPAKNTGDIGLNKKEKYLTIKESGISDMDIPGYVEFNNSNYKPQYFDISFDATVKSGKNYIAVTNIGDIDAGYKFRGQLVCAGNMLETNKNGTSTRKRQTIVIEENENKDKLKIPEEVVKDYIDSLTPFQKESPFSEKYGCLKEGRAVFYTEKNNEVLFFGHSPNFRIPAKLNNGGQASTPRDFVPSNLRDDPDLIDLAESIFGYSADENRKDGRAGRVFFTEAKLYGDQGSVWVSENKGKGIVPKILASPKPTTFQHYLVQDRNKGHDPDTSKLAHYSTSTPSETVIRGFKLYWHQKDASIRDVKETEEIKDKDKQHTLIKPVRKGVTFKFRIYFENLKDYELGALLWVLDIKGEPNKNYRHKLGMVKPFGMGSVKIESEVKVTNREDRYKKLFSESGNSFHEGISPKNSNEEQYINVFEGWLLSKLQSSKDALYKEERIQMLLKMLEWPGPSKKDVRYLEMEPKNEYKDRPVLPDPLNISRDLTNKSSRNVTGNNRGKHSGRKNKSANRSRKRF